MPIYDYKCLVCGKVFELLTSGSGDSKTPACSSCGSQNLERLISVPSLLRNTKNSSTTCCGREERCEKPPCSTGERCRRH
jgi:putative FmdB family regulatory protein